MDNETVEVVDGQDPGEMVSEWHRLKVAFERARGELSGTADLLNGLGSLLREKYGISVPTVAVGAVAVATAQRAPANDDLARFRGDDDDQPVIADGSTDGWSPPEQAALGNGITVTASTGVADIRRDAFDGDSEEGFAGNIASIFNRVTGFIQ